VKFSADFKRFIKSRYEQIRQIRDAPHAVAGGVAIGMFFGFTPLITLKTLLSVFFAWIFRCSKISAVFAVTFHDILAPIWPVILRWEYDLGYWILSNPHHLPQKFTVEKFKWGYWLHLKTLRLLWPTFIGSIVIGIPIALFSYWIVERSLERYEQAHRRHLTPPN
jgi:uncharacterized protein (DUF2062 family)